MAEYAVIRRFFYSLNPISYYNVSIEVGSGRQSELIKGGRQNVQRYDRRG